MSQYPPPMCFSCKLFGTSPNFIGDSGHCLKYKKIPVKIFYQAGRCSFFQGKEASTKKK